MYAIRSYYDKHPNLIYTAVRDGVTVADEIYRTYSEYAERLKPHVADTTAYLLNAVDADKNVITSYSIHYTKLYDLSLRSRT